MRLEWIVDGDRIGTGLRGALTACWRDLSNAGGAVGFPFLPVSDDVVAPAVEVMLADLVPEYGRHRGALRLDADDDRDDVLVRLDVAAS